MWVVLVYLKANIQAKEGVEGHEAGEAYMRSCSSLPAVVRYRQLSLAQRCRHGRQRVGWSGVVWLARGMRHADIGPEGLVAGRLKADCSAVEIVPAGDGCFIHRVAMAICMFLHIELYR